MAQPLHIVAVGARTPLGLSAESSAAAVRAGIDGVTEHPSLKDREAEPLRMAQDRLLDPGLMGPERLIEMAATALGEVHRKLESLRGDLRAIPLLLGLPEERPGWTAERTEAVRRGLSEMFRSPDFHPVELYCHGHAAALTALDAARALILNGKAELCAVCGTESYQNHETLAWLDGNRQLATSYHRGAFFPGEGAGAFVVATESAIRRFRLESLAMIRGIGIAQESRLIKTEAVCLGEGLTEGIRLAVKSLPSPREAIEGVICDLNGERYRSEEWGFAMLRLPEVFVDPTDYDLPASWWGDMGAASGALFVVLAVTAGRRGWAKGRRYLIWTSSEKGCRAAAALELNTQRGVIRL